MEGKRKTYKFGQLVTIENHVYRIVKGFCILCPFTYESEDCKQCQMCLHKIRMDCMMFKLVK